MYLVGRDRVQPAPERIELNKIEIIAGAHKVSRAVKPRVISPLIDDAERARRSVDVRNAVFGEHGKPVRIYHLRHAVVNFGVEVIRSAREHYAVPAVLVKLFYYLLAAPPRPRVEFRLFEVRLFDSAPDLARGNIGKLLREPLCHALGRGYGQERREKLDAVVDKLLAHVEPYDFRVRPDDGAVVMIVRAVVLFALVGQAGIENKLDALVD